MTITSTGPSGFHIKPVVTVLAVAAFAAAAYVFALQIWSNDQPSASAPAEAVAVVEAAEPYTGPSGSAEAFAAGKLDAGLVPEPSPATIGSEPVPEIVVIEGQGRLYDALIEGKYELDFSPGDPPLQYVLVPEAATGPSGQLVEGLGDGTFAERPPAARAAGSTPTVSGGPQE